MQLTQSKACIILWTSLYSRPVVFCYSLTMRWIEAYIGRCWKRLWDPEGVLDVPYITSWGTELHVALSTCIVIKILTKCYCHIYILHNVYILGNYCWWDWKTWYKTCQSWSGSNVYFCFLLFWVHSCFPCCYWNYHSNLLEFELYYNYMQCH